MRVNARWQYEQGSAGDGSLDGCDRRNVQVEGEFVREEAEP
jgi:hypothetical protein